MNQKMFGIVCASVLAAVAYVGTSSAQEMGTAKAAAPAAEKKTAESKVTEVAKQAEAKDQGPQLAAEAAARAADLQTPPASGTFMNAEARVKESLERLKVGVGYDPARKSIIQIGVAGVKVQDPSKSPKYTTLRRMIANRSYMDAKTKVMASIEQQFDAMDRFETFGELHDGVDAHTAFEAKMTDFSSRVKIFTDNLKIVRPELAGELAAQPIGSSFGQVLEALKEQLAEEPVVVQPTQPTVAPSAGEGEGDAQAPNVNAEKPVQQPAKPSLSMVTIKQQLNSLIADYKALQAERDKLAKNPSGTQETVQRTMSRMPMLGCSILTQAESWDETTGEYQVACAVVWSPKLEENAKRIAMGDFTPQTKKGPSSVQEWLKSQNLACMVGSRRFTDNRGATIFVGISARELPQVIGLQSAVRKQVQQQAIHDVAFALVGDVEQTTAISSSMKEFGDENVTLEKIESKMQQKIDALALKGCTEGLTGEYLHPVSGKKLYVAAYYLEPELSRDSAEILKKAYADAMAVTKSSQRTLGRHDGYDQALKEVRDSKDEYKKGVQEGKKDVKGLVEKNERKDIKKQLEGGAKGSEKGTPGKNTGGAFVGDNKVDVDF